MERVEIIGAARHNLRDLHLSLPKECLVVLAGVSGSGKSSLAFDTLFRAGQDRYLAMISPALKRRLLRRRDDFSTVVKGLPPTLALAQGQCGFRFNSTVAVASGTAFYLHPLFSLLAEPVCLDCGRPMIRHRVAEVVNFLLDEFARQTVEIHFNAGKALVGACKSAAEHFLRRGFLKARMSGEGFYLDQLVGAVPSAEDLLIQVDVLEARPENIARFQESVETAFSEGRGAMVALNTEKEFLFSLHWHCPDCRSFCDPAKVEDFSPFSRAAACLGCRGGEKHDPSNCQACFGSGLNPRSLSFRWRDKSIHDLQAMPVSALLEFFRAWINSQVASESARPFLPALMFRLETLSRLRLDYISLHRLMASLSAGESRRVRLAAQLGQNMLGILYVLDEPSSGLHLTERNALISVLRDLVKAGNSVWVVEHDLEVIRAADHLLELGPGAGERGGRVVYNGSGAFFPFSGTLTASFFGRKNKEKKPAPKNRRVRGRLFFRELNCRNIKKLDLDLPTGVLTVICGPSGSGKSTLLFEGLLPRLQALKKNREKELSGNHLVHGDLAAATHIHVLEARGGSFAESSTPLTFLGLARIFRHLYASLPAARIRGLRPSWFDHRSPGGRCEACRGRGFNRLDLGLGPAVERTCPVCRGLRFSSEALTVKWRDLSFAGLMAMTASEALRSFASFPAIVAGLKTLEQLELEYLVLGQRIDTFSGGEKQRMRLAKKVLRPALGPVLHLIDEPTSGLHAREVATLLKTFDILLDRGDTVVVSEHDSQVISAADHLIELGPGGGSLGGRLVYQGDVGGMLACSSSPTGQALKMEEKLCH